jgi:5-keto 4-deoxyuronate isomerase
MIAAIPKMIPMTGAKSIFDPRAESDLWSIESDPSRHALHSYIIARGIRLSKMLPGETKLECQGNSWEIMFNHIPESNDEFWIELDACTAF